MVINRIIALTMGDPSSIAPEITLRAYENLKNKDLPFILIGNIEFMQEVARKKGFFNTKFKEINEPSEGFEYFGKYLPVFNINIAEKPIFGEPNTLNAKSILNSINIATSWALNKQAIGVCTNPVSKEIINKAYKGFLGHTGYIANLSNSKNPIMMFSSPDLQFRTSLLSAHISLKKAIREIKTSNIIKHVISLKKFYESFFKEELNIAIASLNPHASEDGMMGYEEKKYISPAIDYLKKSNIKCNGPFPADSLFNKETFKKYNCILSLYHDQGLIPFKTLYFDCGINISANLPIIRVSPDHGTAFNIAKKNIANPNSLIEAIKIAHRLGNNYYVS